MNLKCECYIHSLKTPLSDGILWMMFTALSASRRSAADDKRKYGSAGAGRCGPSLTAAGKEVAECPITG